MKTITLIVLFSLLIFPFASAQDYTVDETVKAEISKLEFMIGKWEGSGWMMGRDGQKHTFDQTEDLQFKLDGTTILIEGEGSSEGKTVHKALAVISYSKTDSIYSFQSYMPDGRSGGFKAELKDGKFYWYPNEFITYIISTNEKGQWYETGEMKRGDTSFQFFEMTLDPVK